MKKYEYDVSYIRSDYPHYNYNWSAYNILYGCIYIYTYTYIYILHTHTHTRARARAFIRIYNIFYVFQLIIINSHNQILQLIIDQFLWLTENLDTLERGFVEKRPNFLVIHSTQFE